MVSGANLLRKEKVTGSQKSGLRPTERTSTYTNSCVYVCGLKDTALDPAVQSQATFQSSGVCAVASKLVSGSLGRSHAPGQPPLSNRGFKNENPLSRHIWQYLGQHNAFPSWPVGPAEGDSVDGCQHHGLGSSLPPHVPTPLKSAYSQELQAHPPPCTVRPPAPPLLIINKQSLADRGSRRDFLPTGSELSTINSHNERLVA